MELLARLTPGTQDWDALPPGISELTPTEMAGLLSGLSGGPLYLLRAKYIGDETVIPELVAVTVSRASKWFTILDVKDLKTEIQEPIRYLSQAGIFQAIHPPRCRVCLGRGIVYPRASAVRDCTACGATGRGKMGGEAVRRALGLSRGMWKRHEQKYHQIESLLGGWLAFGVGHVKRQLAGDR